MSRACVEAGCYEVKRDRGWGDGPWNGEPDRIDFRWHGFDCFTHRAYHSSGAWCGYVAVPRRHPAFGHDMADLPSLSCNGGITYARSGGGAGHLAAPKRWVIGFDCSHAGDYSPKIEAHLVESGFYTTYPQYRKRWDAPRSTLFPDFPDEHYWTLAEVVADTKDLAAQLAVLRGANVRFDKQPGRCRDRERWMERWRRAAPRQLAEMQRWRAAREGAERAAYEAVAGSEDDKVEAAPIVSRLVTEERWAEFNRKFNELLMGEESDGPTRQ